jgi:hypothetical protein
VYPRYGPIGDGLLSTGDILSIIFMALVHVLLMMVCCVALIGCVDCVVSMIVLRNG